MLLLFGAISGSLIAAASSGVIHDLAFKTSAMTSGIVLGAAAILLAFRTRVFAIRSRDRTLEVITRLLPGIIRKESHPLGSTRAVLETVVNRWGRRVQHFRIEIDGGPSWILGSGYPGDTAEKPARQLAQDLGTTLTLISRNRPP